MKFLMFLLLFLAAILPFFRLLTFISKRRNRRTPAQVADAIEKHIEGRDGPHDWDDFTSVPFADDHLEAIRRICCDVGGAPKSQKDLEELKRIIAELRSSTAEVSTG